MTIAAKRAVALSIFLGSSAAFGVADLLLYANTGWPMISLLFNTLIGAATIVAWCRFDSIIHVYPLTTRLSVSIFLLAIVAVPVYLVRSRGWTAAAKLGFGLPIFLLAIGLYHGCWHATFWIADHAGYFA